MKKSFGLIFFILLSLSVQVIFAQKNCSGAEIFTQKNCAGDELSNDERELFRLINEYRKQKNLPEVTLSNDLSLVASRHLRDLNLNLKYLTHSWSDCEFNDKDSKTWNCIFNAPKKFFPDFSGIGFENVYFISTGKVIPLQALEGWKKSPLHNSVILNLDNFKNYNWSEGGVAIDGKYAALWFAAPGSLSGRIKKTSDAKGLGFTLDEVVKNLTSVLTINNVSSTVESKKWIGNSADKSAVLEIYGQTEEIVEVKMTMRVKLEKIENDDSRNKKMLQLILDNLAPSWSERERWLDASIEKLRLDPKTTQKMTNGKISFELSADTNGFISLKAKPKPAMVEL